MTFIYKINKALFFLIIKLIHFLIINKDLKSKFGDYSYEVIDTKNSNKPKPDHIIQLGMYTYMLEEAQGILPKRFTIVLKDKIE